MKLENNVDLLLLADSSDSMTDENYDYLIDQLADAVEDKFPSSSSRLSFVLFADSSSVRMDLEMGDPFDLSVALRNQFRMSGSPSRPSIVLKYQIFFNVYRNFCTNFFKIFF